MYEVDDTPSSSTQCARRAFKIVYTEELYRLRLGARVDVALSYGWAGAGSRWREVELKR